MLDLSIFDEYGRKAQLSPALLVIMPPLGTLLVLYPNLVSLKGTIGVLAVSCGILYFLANLGRGAGRRKQDELFPDGLPTHRFLRHSDLSIEAPTKARYKAFLVEKVSGLKFPTAEEEQQNPTAADDNYRSAVRWLVDNTREYKRVQQELIAYGFRRNLYGLKPQGLALSLIIAIISGVALWVRYGASIDAVPAEAVMVLVADAVVVPIVWLTAIKPAWVRATADSYAFALLGFCDVEKRASKTKSK